MSEFSMNHTNLQKENEELKKQNKELLARLREYDIKGTHQENTDPESASEQITKGIQKPQFLGDMSEFTLVQMKTSFEQNFDEESVNALHGKELEEYHWKKVQYELICQELVERHV